MSEQDESEVEHTLFIVERDDLDDAVPYQVMKAEHPPDSEQAKALEGVMCQLVEAAEAETGEPHRLVTEADTPEITQRHYETHEERIEGETLVTDGGQPADGIGRDDLKLCWCCDGIHDSPGSLCPNCEDARCNRFTDECKSDHDPAFQHGGSEVTE